MKQKYYHIIPIGRVGRSEEKTFMDIDPKYRTGRFQLLIDNMDVRDGSPVIEAQFGIPFEGDSKKIYRHKRV